MLNIKFLHNVHNLPNVNLSLNSETIALNLGYKEMTETQIFKSGEYRFSVKTSLGNAKIISKTINLKYDGTLVLSGDGTHTSSVKALFLPSGNDFENGYASISFLHSAHNVPKNIDLYVNGEILCKNIRYGSYETNLKIKLSGQANKYTQSITLKDSSSGEALFSPKEIYFASNTLYELFLSGDINQLGMIISVNDSHVESELQSCFDPQRYMGRWYQIASFPQFFNGNCDRSVAEYTLLDGGVKVFNICYDKEWNIVRTVTGLAVNPKCDLKPSLKVSFQNVPVFVQNREPNYLVHSTDYENYAIIGDPIRSNLYILSRKSQMNKTRYEKLLKRCKKLGYDTSKLKVDYKALI
jgi:apolipoprotein D and lipocalin family protein